MTLVGRLNCRFDRHDWTSFGACSITAEACRHCRAPKTPKDRVKLEVQATMKEQLKSDQGDLFGPICQMAERLLRERLTEQNMTQRRHCVHS